MRFKMTLMALLFAACSGSTGDPAQQIARLPLGIENRYGLTTEETFTTVFDKNIQEYFARGQDVSFTSRHGGLAINARKFTPEDPARDNGAAIVISSGRTEGLIIYPELIYDLQRQGYTVYIHDHRGQGASARLIKADAQRSHVDEFAYYVDDLKTFVDKEVKPHHERRFLLAHSMGGAIASLYVEQFKNDFAALALVTPMNQPIFLRKGLTTSVAWLNRWIPGWADERYGVGQVGYAPRDFAKNDLTHSRVRYLKTHQIYGANPSNQLGGVTHRWIRQAYNAAKQTIEKADDVEIPVLLLQASEDTAVASAAQDEFCAKVNRRGKGSCTEFVVDKSFHALFNEADTFRVPALTTVLDFFDHPPANQQAARSWQPGSPGGALLVSR